MKPVVLTAHAQHVAQQRGILTAWIEKTAHDPDWTTLDPSGAQRCFGHISERENRILRVVCVETDTELRVITVFFDRNARSPR